MDAEALRRDSGSMRTKLLYGFGSVASRMKDNGLQTDRSHYEENLRKLAAEAEHVPASEHP